MTFIGHRQGNHLSYHSLPPRLRQNNFNQSLPDMNISYTVFKSQLYLDIRLFAAPSISRLENPRMESQQPSLSLPR